MNNLKKYILIAGILFIFIPNSISAAICEPGTVPSNTEQGQLCNPAEHVAGNKISTFLVNTLRIFAGAAGIVAIVFVVFSGFQFLLSQGNTEKVEAAKRSLQWSLSGLVLIILSFVIISGIRLFLQVRDIPKESYEGTPTVINPTLISNFPNLYVTLINGFFGILGLIAIFIIILNGFRYITARGNDEQAQRARLGLQYAVLGVIIAILAYVIVRATATFFGAK